MSKVWGTCEVGCGALVAVEETDTLIITRCTREKPRICGWTKIEYKRPAAKPLPDSRAGDNPPASNVSSGGA